jgi:ribosomal protein L11 methylase PrmA
MAKQTTSFNVENIEDKPCKVQTTLFQDLANNTMFCVHDMISNLLSKVSSHNHLKVIINNIIAHVHNKLAEGQKI